MGRQESPGKQRARSEQIHSPHIPQRLVAVGVIEVNDRGISLQLTDNGSLLQ
jgi:hypothetical protein